MRKILSLLYLVPVPGWWHSQLSAKKLDKKEALKGRYRTENQRPESEG